MVIRIGMIGAGFIARLHATALRSLGPDAAQIVGVAARTEGPREAFASEFGIRDTYADYRQLLERADVDAVDLCVPNHLHHPMTVAAAQAGKHVYCEKPLTGYFGRGEAAEQVSKTPREVMLRETLTDADEMLAACAASGVQLCYGEDWVYAPVLEKARRLVQVSSSPIMELRGEESHNGSHADYAKRWATSGGGALLRLGVHPIGAALQLKRWEGRLRQGRPIRAAAVTAEVATLTDIGGVPRGEGSWLVTDWVDVENWSTTIIHFEDGSRGVFIASDNILGGIVNYLELTLAHGRIKCNMTPNNMCEAYAPDGTVWGDEYITEKIQTSAGWTYPSPDEDWVRGFPHELADFVAATRDNRPPLSDGELGRDCVEVIYAAYLAAARGARVSLPFDGD